MIGRLVGQVADWDADGVLFDVGGVGYEVACAPPTVEALRAMPAPVTLWVVTEVREDAFDLYGFRNREEKVWYGVLRGVQGVGPRVALALLATLRPEALLLALGSGDRAALTRASGVGPKLAARLVTELKDKVGAMALAGPVAAAAGGAGPAAPAGPPPDAGDGVVADAVSALTNLGYGRSDAFRAVGAERQAQGEEASLNALIRGSLKRLSTQ
ncbi:MAG: Holliday junction branch migration protein RuvA [Roseitalea porphyridii]|uniref:Holliday junction branch migration protein RuvA n=1 Tax=Roseitalea porphyridii TaxID=1852022 RepID=UPI0032F05469